MLSLLAIFYIQLSPKEPSFQGPYRSSRYVCHRLCLLTSPSINSANSFFIRDCESQSTNSRLSSSPSFSICASQASISRLSLRSECWLLFFEWSVILGPIISLLVIIIAQSDVSVKYFYAQLPGWPIVVDKPQIFM